MRRRLLVIVLAVGLLPVGVGLAAGAIITAAAPRPHLEAAVAPLDQFTPVTPVRLIDTRSGQGADLPGRRHPGETIPVSVPPGALAVSVTLTLVDPDRGGWLVAWSGRLPLPSGSTMNDNGTPLVNGYAVVEVDPLCSCFRVYFSPQLDSHLVVDMVGVYSRQPEFAVGPPPTLPGGGP